MRGRGKLTLRGGGPRRVLQGQTDEEGNKRGPKH